jgi:hypothetical protein
MCGMTFRICEALECGSLLPLFPLGGTSLLAAHSSRHQVGRALAEGSALAASKLAG